MDAASLHQATYCACDDSPLLSIAQKSDQQDEEPFVAPLTTKQPNKCLLKRLFRELRSVADTPDPIVHKSFKNQPAKKRRRGKETFPGSEYIGVSRNGRKWQALLLVGNRKLYLGTLESEEETAVLHDRHALLNHGIKKVCAELANHLGPDKFLVLKARYLCTL